MTLITLEYRVFERSEVSRVLAYYFTVKLFNTGSLAYYLRKSKMKGTERSQLEIHGQKTSFEKAIQYIQCISQIPTPQMQEF